MRKMFIILVLALASTFKPTQVSAQKQEIAQLVLNVEKLRQFKQILEDLKKGYEILYKGYNTIKDISEGNFKLHKSFLDALLTVSPTVKNYYKVGGIVSMQVSLIKEYKSAYERFKEEGNLTADEIRYIGGVYANLVSLSLRNLDELVNVVTADKLRMSDDERLKAIDGIFDQMEDKLSFLRHFNGNTSLLSAQRAKDRHDAKAMQKILEVGQ
jgi:hypothetical protein